MKVFDTQVAGLFYPEHKRDLISLIDKYLDDAVDLGVPAKRLKAIMVPHAGYYYSGNVSAYAYRIVSEIEKKIKNVYLLAPSHRYPFEYISMFGSDIWRTPLGEVELNTDLVEEYDGDLNFRIDSEKYIQEHSLEVQLPFLQRVIKSFKLTPFCIGQQVKKKAISDKILHNLKEDDLIVVSSDLSHYENYDEAVRTDDMTIRAILEKDTDYFSSGENLACGHEAIEIVLLMAQKNNWKVKLLKYQNSGDVTKDYSSVVGYTAMAFYV